MSQFIELTRVSADKSGPAAPIIVNRDRIISVRPSAGEDGRAWVAVAGSSPRMEYLVTATYGDMRRALADPTVVRA